MSAVDAGWIDLTAADGHRLRAYAARARGPELGRVIVVQELLGVTAHIRTVCERFAATGYHAVAPAFYDRVARDTELSYDPDDIRRGQSIAAQLPVTLALHDVAGALTYLGGERAAAVVGYCWGGAIAWGAATQLPVRAAIVYYGNIAAALDAPPRVPTQLHFAEHDHAIPIAVLHDAKRRHPALIAHVYSAGHGFNCDERESFHADSAALAAFRTRGLLNAVF